MDPKPNFYQRVLPDCCIDFSSLKGQEVFENAVNGSFMKSFFKLGLQLQTQKEPPYCGLSSLVIILNAFSVDPGIVWKGVWRWYDEDMLGCCATDIAKQNGITLDQLSDIAKCNFLESQTVYADDKLTVETLKKEIKSVCQSPNKALVVSFGRQSLGQTGTGHFAPIGGFSEEDDLVLILEPARFKYPSYWISISLLLEAMKTIDPVIRKPRGYLVLQKCLHQPTLLHLISNALNILPPFREEFLHIVQNSLDFLKQHPSEDTSSDIVLMNAIQQINAVANSSSASKESILFTNVNISDIEVFAPEHQQSISLLGKRIEQTDIHEFIMESVLCNLSWQTDKVQNYHLKQDQHTHVTVREQCILGFPHFLTLLLCMLPVLAPNNSKKMDAKFQLPMEEYSNSYLKRVVDFVNRTLSSLQNSYPPSSDDNDISASLMSEILLNEINQLQMQLERNLKLCV